MPGGGGGPGSRRSGIDPSADRPGPRTAAWNNAGRGASGRGEGVMVLLDVRDLLEKPGAARRVTLEERFDQLGTELARGEEPVRLEITLASVIEGVEVRGPPPAPPRGGEPRARGGVGGGGGGGGGAAAPARAGRAGGGGGGGGGVF